MIAEKSGTLLLEVSDVHKSFGATHALQGADFELRPGEFHALLGGNGAGKSTLIKILSGVITADRGAMTVCGEPLTSTGRRRRSHRLAVVHQSLGLVESMTVAENFALLAGFETRAGLVREGALRRQAEETLARLDADVPTSAPVSSLGVAERAMVAIARALHSQARVLILDEPTANLSARDAAVVFDSLRALRAHGVGVVYVSHRLSEVFDLCDRVTVLRNGRTELRAAVRDVDRTQLVDAITGGIAASAGLAREVVERRGAKPRLRVEQVRSGRLGPVDLEVYPGEIVSCTGQRGSGTDRLARCLTGREQFTGRVVLSGRDYRPRSPKQALERGVAYVSGDRRATLAPGLSVRENLLLDPTFTPLPGWLRRRGRENALTRDQLRRYRVRSGAPDRDVVTLSGGNAQKLVFARAGLSMPQVLVLEDPTAGVDVGARATFYESLREACRRGAGVLLITTDYDEALLLGDRVVVLAGGCVVADLAAAEADATAVTDAAMG